VLWHVEKRSGDHPAARAKVTLHPTPHTLHPTPYTLHPTPYTLHPTPHTLHPDPKLYTLHPKSQTLNPTPGQGAVAFERTRHTYDSHGQILALTSAIFQRSTLRPTNPPP